jgi:hypothetical protein
VWNNYKTVPYTTKVLNFVTTRGWCDLINRRGVFWIGHWIYWTYCLQYLIAIYSGSIANLHSLQFTKHALSPLGLMSLQQSSGTGFQRLTFPFLESRTVPVPQPQRLTVRSPSWTLSSCLLMFCLSSNSPSSPLILSSDSCGIVIMERPLWRVVGSVV